MFDLVPMTLLHRPRCAGSIGRDELARRADQFAAGRWTELINQARQTATRISRDEAEDQRRRGNAAQSRIQHGKSQGAARDDRGSVGSENGRDSCRTPADTPTRTATADLSPEILESRPEVPLSLDKELFVSALRSSPSGTAPGPGGCTNEMLHMCKDDAHVLDLLCLAAEDFARGETPASRSFLRAMMTALSKNGGIRGIATGSSFRRLEGKTLARQFGAVVEVCAPFQFALSSRAGTDCVGHAIRVMTDLDARATVLSVDRVGAYDHVLRSSMLEKLMEVHRLRPLIPFVRSTYAQPPPVTKGKTSTAHDTGCGSMKAVSWETHSCLCSSAWRSTTHSPKSRST